MLIHPPSYQLIHLYIYPRTGLCSQIPSDLPNLPWCYSVTKLCPTLCDPWTAAHQASPCFTTSPSFLKLMSIQSMMPSSVVTFSSCLQSFPASESFLMSWFFVSGGQRIRASASTSVLPMNIQNWFPLGWTDWISLQSKGFSRVFFNITVQRHQFFSSQLSF